VSQDLVDRLKAVASAPLLLMSILSNFYFFTDIGVGNILTRKAILDGNFTKNVVFIYLFNYLFLVIPGYSYNC